MLKNIKEAVAYIKSKEVSVPEIGIILGTGLGGLVKEIDIKQSISYEDIPHFPLSTVESHSGRLIFGILQEIGGNYISWKLIKAIKFWK